MGEGEPTAAALRSADGLDSAQLLELLERVRVEPGEGGDVDVDTIAASVDPRTLGKQDFSRLLLAFERLRADGADVDVADIRPHTFATLISKVSKAQLADALARAELRAVMLDEIFRRMGSHLRADRAASTRAVVHWRFTSGSGESGYDRYESAIADGDCTVSREMAQRPRVTVTLSPADFIQLIVGRASAPVLFMTGKLKVKGDLAFAAGLMGLFDLPRPD